ncbi:MAG: DUF1329 domain-containing protein, partial [Myxococcota bacterium]
MWLLGLPFLLVSALAAFAQPVEGEVIGFDRVEELRPFLPVEFWQHRALFFYDGMQLEIGPARRDYRPAPEYRAITERHSSSVKLGPDGSLVGYLAGQPFPMDAIDCAGDPQAGVKVAWNFDRRWQGNGSKHRFRTSFWDRGEELSAHLGKGTVVETAHRVERAYAEQGGDLLPGKRLTRSVALYSVGAPFELRGITLLHCRWKGSDPHTSWVYLPKDRRVRRFSGPDLGRALPGTDFVLEDLEGFGGRVMDYAWECRGAAELLAPMNTRVAGYPYAERRFGPTGLSFADDRFELRRTVTLRLVPKHAGHPLAAKDLIVDAETLEPLYSFAYDRKGELWKVAWHAHRWSGDALGEIPAAAWYPGWEGVPEPRDLRTVADASANVQTGSGTRSERWDDQGAP